LDLSRFSPSNLRIGSKITLVVAVMTIPLVALLAVEYSHLSGRTTTAETEHDGLTYVNAIIPVIKAVQDNRLAAVAVQNGDTASKDVLDRSTNDIESKIANLKNVDKNLGGNFNTADLFDKIDTDWAAVKTANAKPSVPESLATHAKLINSDLIPLVARVGNSSKLFLDPDAQSVKDVGGILQDLLVYEEALSNAVAYGADVTASRQNQPPTDVQKDYLNGQAVRANAASDSFDSRVSSAVAANHEFKNIIGGAQGTARTQRFFFYSTINTEIVTAKNITVPTSSFVSAGNNATDAAFAAFTAAGSPLGAEFQRRIDDSRNSEYIAGGIAFGGIFIALLLSVIVARTITKPLGRLAEVADRMSLGELDIDIDVAGKNEVGQLAESLRRMQASLRSAIERLRMRRAA
jgi:HAMP domain-containing protein